MEDTLSVEAIVAAMSALRATSLPGEDLPKLGQPVLFFAQVGSTNDVARELAAAGAAEGLVVVADEQTAGRGRLDRRWWAPPGGSLLMSLVLRPPIQPIRAGQLTMCLGLGAAEGIEAVTGLRPSLKWPNDLLLVGRKLGGMLTELGLSGQRLEYAVLGLGVNVNIALARPGPRQAELPAAAPPPPEVAESGVSLSDLLGRPVNRAELLASILVHCERWYHRLLRGESPHQAWSARLETLGRTVTVSTPTGDVRGRAEGVTAEGALLVHAADGQVHTIWTGDVVSVLVDGTGHAIIPRCIAGAPLSRPDGGPEGASHAVEPSQEESS